MSTSLSPYMDQILKNSMNSFNFMNTHKILPTSENYQLWYSYTAQDDFSLNRVVDKLITNKTSLDEDISKKLYKKFFSEDTENKTLVNTSRGFKDEITKLKFILQDAGKDTSSYSGSINNQKDKLTNFNGSDELKEIAKLVVQDIENINSQTQKLNAQIDKSSKKIETLKNNLEDSRLESRTDALTGIGNRKYFDEEILSLVEKTKDEDDNFCLVIGDIDYFKKFNDTFGHQVGDEVLKVVAQVLKNTSGILATPYRYGGEEFVILVPKSQLNDASKLSNNIKKAISHKSIKNKDTGQNFGKITMSFGIAQFANDENPESIIRRADAALYLAKDNGRNRVQIETDLNEETLRKTC